MTLYIFYVFLCVLMQQEFPECPAEYSEGGAEVMDCVSVSGLCCVHVHMYV